MSDQSHAERQRRYRDRQKTEQVRHVTAMASMEGLLHEIQRRRAENEDPAVLLDYIEATLSGLTTTDSHPDLGLRDSERHVTFDLGALDRQIDVYRKLAEAFAISGKAVTGDQIVELLGGPMPAALFMLCVRSTPWINFEPSRDAGES